MYVLFWLTAFARYEYFLHKCLSVNYEKNEIVNVHFLNVRYRVMCTDQSAGCLHKYMYVIYIAI